MTVEFLDAMAQAIYFYEGHQPQDINHRNNNPGNLRPGEGNSLPVNEGYVVFPSFIEGYQALLEDIRGKIIGSNGHGLDESSSLEQFFEVYAPSSDHNQPVRYAQFVAHWLGESYGKVFTSANSFKTVLMIIDQEVD